MNTPKLPRTTLITGISNIQGSGVKHTLGTIRQTPLIKPGLKQ